jgi:hypothetical protein
MRSSIPIFVVAFFLVGFVEVATADEFRVESKVFAEGSETPISESLTLFHQGHVYDLLSSPQEITVFDLPENRIVLLDPTRKVRAELKTDQLTYFVDQLRVRASRQADPMLKFAAEPKFAEKAEDNGWMSFASPLLSYRVHGARAAVPAQAQAYREFSDWSARLKTRVDQGALPPYPRLYLNAALERRGWLPDEVERTVTQPNQPDAKPTVLRSKHKFETQLYTADHKRIEEASDYAKSFKAVPLGEYLRQPQQARR